MTDDRSPYLLWTPEGAPRSGRFDDVYFSRQDGLAETRAVFLDGCGLPDAWAGRGDFTVGELGFGTGLNIAALLELWRREGPADGRLHLFSIEAFPLSRDEAARALAAWPQIAPEAQALLDVWPQATPGFHRLDLPAYRATLDLAVGDAAWALAQWDGRADAWFLDGFAPSTNPGMWSDAVMDGLQTRSAPGARLATFTVAGAVRRGLAQRGFAVDKRPGHGRKRERLEARAPGAAAPPPTPGLTAVIGAGIAGASLARALTRLGRPVVVIEAEAPGAGGSGFAAGLVTPRLDIGDGAIAALYAQALRRAGDLYATVPEAVTARGVLQLPGMARDAARFPKAAAQDIWATEALKVLDAPAASRRLDEPVDEDGLWMAPALAVRPRLIVDAWLRDVPVLTGRIARIEGEAGAWRLLDADGALVTPAAQVIIAAGWGAAALEPMLNLRPVRGQAEWVEGVHPPVAAAWGGYVVPTGDGLLFGATHDRDDTDTDVRATSREQNKARLNMRLPGLAQRVEGLEIHSRAAVRATTPDRLPLVGERAPGLHVLTGLGSRGLCLAPLLAEHLAARIAGAPSPLPHELAMRIDVARPTKPTAPPGASM
ncbi:FAD-dependent 5-carboxymethylaminomethyl-2-thiouridine(34) oxidoreductase MnmC [uncultured Brevundimonas sp.]|nr:FAD-dependent 5-carboxymethylaminomethyl-2-thiouridine(34) oxidoreductase MnmC [uncultured Brevundimonas sp.]